MTKFSKKKIYMDNFRKILENQGPIRKGLFVYLDKQLDQLNQLIEIISQENFWQVFPQILGIDAKLNLIIELIPFEDFSNDEIIRMIETDYRYYYKELCGYSLNMEKKNSMIFNII